VSAASSLRKFRFEIPLLAVAIVAIGIAYIHSASFDMKVGTFKPYAPTQAKWLAIALAAFTAALVVPYQKIERHAWLLYGAALALLVGVHFFGAAETNGARSWYKWGETKFQPSEVAKIAIICATAKTLMYRRDIATWRAFGAIALVGGPPLLSILCEPDLGTVLVFSPVLLVMLFVAGGAIRHFLTIGAAGAVAGVYAFFFRFGRYQKDRILVFLPERLLELCHYEIDKAHMVTAAHQTTQAHKAIGSGGLFGAGLGLGLHAFPEAHTDFIFSVVGEEGGFVMTTLLLLLLLALLLVCVDVAARTREPFGRLVAAGVAALFAGQIVVNAGMNIGLMPVTGITLPFVSYGGSSLLTSFLSLGLVANIAMHPVPILADDFRSEGKAR
jgi:rod shape determining protein RodA